jgi:hypothetical protein
MHALQRVEIQQGMEVFGHGPIMELRTMRGKTMVALIHQPHPKMPGKQARRTAPIFKGSEKAVEDNQIGSLALGLAMEL